MPELLYPLIQVLTRPREVVVGLAGSGELVAFLAEKLDRQFHRYWRS